MDNPKIYVAFRFNVNLSKALGENEHIERDKLIMMLERILYSLSRSNDEGIGVKGTWALENHTTLKYLMEDKRDVFSHLKERIENGDELETAGFSGNLLSFMDNLEIDYALKSIVNNEEETGLKDVFSDFAPIMRTESFLCSPSLIAHLKTIGIACVSFSHSRTPKTSMTNLISELSPIERHNPVTYVNESTLDKMTAVLSVNEGDFFGRFGIVNFLKKMRKEQLSSRSKKNMFLLVDYDLSEDMFLGLWHRMKLGKNEQIRERGGGFLKMLKMISKLDFLEFTTPHEYVLKNPPIATLSLPMDMSEGAFEGLSTLAENPFATKLFSKIEKARHYTHRVRAIAKANNVDIPCEIEQSIKKRVLALSANNFVFDDSEVFERRFGVADKLADDSVSLARAAFEKLHDESGDVTMHFDSEYYYSDDSAKCLVFMGRKEGEGTKQFMADEHILPSYSCPVLPRNGIIVDAKDSVQIKEINSFTSPPIEVEANEIENEFIKLVVLPFGAVKVFYKGAELVKRAFRPQFRYGKKLYRGNTENISVYNLGIGQVLKISGSLSLDKGQKSSYEYVFTLMNGIPSIYFDGKIEYPFAGSSKKLTEIMPFELVMNLRSNIKTSYTITKHNFFGDQSSFVIPKPLLEKNKHLTSFNNAISAGYIAVSNGKQGILLGQRVGADYNFAFCPLKVGYTLGELSLRLNPFGTYSGKQHANQLARTPISAFVTLKRNGYFKSSAPKYAGRSADFSLIISPFLGEVPSEGLLKRYYVFASAFLNDKSSDKNK